MQYWSTLRKLGRYGRHFPLPLFCVNFFAMHRGLCIITSSIHRFAFFTTIQTYPIFRQNITGRVKFCCIYTLLIPLKFTTSFPSSHPNERCVQMLVCLRKREKSNSVSWRWERVTCKLLSLNKLKEALYALTFFRRVSSTVIDVLISYTDLTPFDPLPWGVWVLVYLTLGRGRCGFKINDESDQGNLTLPFSQMYVCFAEQELSFHWPRNML